MSSGWISGTWQEDYTCLHTCKSSRTANGWNSCFYIGAYTCWWSVNHVHLISSTWLLMVEGRVHLLFHMTACLLFTLEILQSTLCLPLCHWQQRCCLSAARPSLRAALTQRGRGQTAKSIYSEICHHNFIKSYFQPVYWAAAKTCQRLNSVFLVLYLHFIQPLISIKA